MIVLPFLASLFKVSTIYKALKLSRPDVGSSNRITDGLVMISTPIDVLFLSPPDISFLVTDPIIVLQAAFKDNSSNNSLTNSSCYSCGIFNLNLAAKVKASLGVKN